jgi:hypothetical protein
MLAIPEFGRLSALFPDAGLDEAMLGEVVGAAAALAEDVWPHSTAVRIKRDAF